MKIGIYYTMVFHILYGRTITTPGGYTQKKFKKKKKNSGSHACIHLVATVFVRNLLAYTTYIIIWITESDFLSVG